MNAEGQPLARRATIADVAALAGVSRAAVSKEFNDTGRISEATANRVRDAARELRWTPSATAVALRRARSRTIRLVLTRSTNYFGVGANSSLLLEGIKSVLSSIGYGLLLDVAGETAFEGVPPDRGGEARGRDNPRRQPGRGSTL